MNKDYEIVVLFHPDLEIDIDKALKKVEGLVKGQKGTITTSDNWGKRKLAYPIKKQEHAIYVYYEVNLPPEGVAKLEYNLNITKEVIRYIVTHPVPKMPEREGRDGDREDSDKESSDDKNDKEEK